MATKILILGGYGLFGEGIARLLCHHARGTIVIAGRHEKKAQDLANRLTAEFGTHVEARPLNVRSISPQDLTQLGSPIVIDATGPFQKHNYGLVEAAIAARCHYIDIADDRAFVSGISQFDAAAKTAGVTIISGASTVPAISSAVVDQISQTIPQIRKLRYGISPGNRTRRSHATIASILSYVGKPFSTLIDGQHKQVFGWQDVHRVSYPTVGKRWFANCNTPDLELFPEHYPSLQTIRFGAGLELSFLHLSTWLLSWIVRMTRFQHLDKATPVFQRISSLLRPLGSDTGGMHVFATGADAQGQELKQSWYLIARNGHGPYVPAVPSAILAGKLISETGLSPGARTGVSSITQGEIADCVAHLDIEIIEPPIEYTEPDQALTEPNR